MSSDGDAEKPAEGTEVHTRILRVMLAADDCYAYWQQVDLEVPPAERAEVAFQRRWFGPKSEARVRTLMGDMALRFDAYAPALRALHAWQTVPAAARPWICHFHVQLADPVYRRFTGDFLPGRRAQGFTKVDRESSARWVEQLEPGRWSPVTALKFAANMLSTAADAGILKERRDPRQLILPPVPDLALGYLLYLLRSVVFEGSLLDNPYLRSVGIVEDEVPRRLSNLPGLSYRALGGARDLEWQYDDLTGWVRGQREAAA